jgi:hypothetical protein
MPEDVGLYLITADKSGPPRMRWMHDDEACERRGRSAWCR